MPVEDDAEEVVDLALLELGGREEVDDRIDVRQTVTGRWMTGPTGAVPAW